MLKNDTGKRVHINWKGKWLHVTPGDVVDLPDSYAHRYGFDVVKEEVSVMVTKLENKPVPEVFDVADVNKDGKVDVADAVEVVKKLIKPKKRFFKKLKKK